MQFPKGIKLVNYNYISIQHIIVNDAAIIKLTEFKKWNSLEIYLAIVSSLSPMNNAI